MVCAELYMRYYFMQMLLFQLDINTNQIYLQYTIHCHGPVSGFVPFTPVSPP